MGIWVRACFIYSPANTNSGGLGYWSGSDIPDIEPSLIAKAFSLLKRHDWVLGPAVDGGFWAIGTRRRPWRPPDFGGIPWGSATVMAETSSRLRGSLALLPSLSDVDQADDLRQWRRHGPF